MSVRVNQFFLFCCKTRITQEALTKNIIYQAGKIVSVLDKALACHAAILGLMPASHMVS